MATLVINRGVGGVDAVGCNRVKSVKGLEIRLENGDWSEFSQVKAAQLSLVEIPTSSTWQLVIGQFSENTHGRLDEIAVQLRYFQVLHSVCLSAVVGPCFLGQTFGTSYFGITRLR